MDNLYFDDDSRTLTKLGHFTDKQSLQDDLDKLAKWSEKNVIQFWEVYKCIHIGHGNMDEEYKMGVLYWVEPHKKRTSV